MALFMLLGSGLLVEQHLVKHIKLLLYPIAVINIDLEILQIMQHMLQVQ
jgi:hypothetical protein